MSAHIEGKRTGQFHAWFSYEMAFMKGWREAACDEAQRSAHYHDVPKGALLTVHHERQVEDTFYIRVDWSVSNESA